MELKQLEYFTIVCEKGSFSQAAECLYTSQPNVSKVISSLEKELGRKLVERSSRGLRITPYGETVRDYAKVILKHASLISSMATHHNGKKFTLATYTQLDSALDTLRANRTKNIVFVGNNVQTKALAAALPEKNVLFAFALSAGHREADRVVSIDLKKITIGQLTGAKSNKQLIGRIFHGTKYKVVYESNMEDYLLCHAAFVMPAAFACYKTDGDLKKLRGDTAYLNRVLDANIEGYRAIRDAGHTILPKEDADFEGEKYRKTCLRFFKLMCATSLGKLCASDHAMNAIDEMSALNRDLKKFFDEHGAVYPVWQALEAEAGRYLQ